MPAANSHAHVLLDPLLRDNAITVQILGICSAMAVTTRLATAAVMCAAVIAVLTVSNAAISLIRRHLPRNIRLIVQITIIASLVMIVDQVLQAYAWRMSRELSVFVGLIVTNCIVLGRAEAFASHHPPGLSALDGLGNALGYSLVLLAVASVRELLGAGTLAGRTVLPVTGDGGWYHPIALMLLPPSAFFIIGLMIWCIRATRPEQVERSEFRILPAP